MVEEGNLQVIVVVGMVVVVEVGVGMASPAILNFEVCLENTYFLLEDSEQYLDNSLQNVICLSLHMVCSSFLQDTCRTEF